MKGLFVDVYRDESSDCSNGGITAYKKTILLIAPNMKGLYEPKQDAIYLEIRTLTTNRGDYVFAVPMQNGKTLYPGKLSMFGGNFVYSSDSRFSESVCRYPIPVHDRFEWV